jgi:hypothetical protein
MEAGVHRFVEDRGGDFRICELRIHRERQLDKTRALFMEVCAPTRESLHDDQLKVALHVTEMVRNVLLDHADAALEARPYFAGVDIGPRVVDHDRDSEQTSGVL